MRYSSVAIAALVLSSCNGGGEGFSFLSTSTTETPKACDVTVSTPSAPGSTIRIAQSAASPTQVVVVPTDDTCVAAFKLNGSSITSSGPSASITSAMLAVGANTLEVTLTNAISTKTVSWTLAKNSAPTCSGQTPATAGVTFNYATTQNFSTNFADADADSITATWLLDSVQAPSQFTASSTATTKSAVFQGVQANVGNGRIVAVQLSDGYDTTTCSWSVNIQDANLANVSACTPSGTSPGSPLVITEQGSGSTQTLTATVSGAGINNSTGLQWRMEAPGGSYANVAGQTTNVLNATASIAPAVPGTYRFTIRATDSYSNTDECDFPIYVKSNDAPSFVGSPSPATNTVSTPIRYNGANTRTFIAGTSVSDTNNDTITYTWSLDGTDNYRVVNGVKTTLSADARLSVNAGTPLQATYDALANSSGLGAHVIKVKIDDGYENTSLSWFINPNKFSDECNEITAGQICTLVGFPGFGDGLDPSLVANATKIRISPRAVVVHNVSGTDNYLFSDDINHVVMYYNRTASDLSYFGKLIPAGKLRVILGSGVALSGNQAPITDSNPLKRNPTKISTPLGVAINNTDPSNPIAYVALYNNNRVVAVSNSGVTPFFTGNTDNSTTPANSLVISSTGARCQNPYGLAYDQTSDKLFVTCANTQSVRVVNGVSTLDGTTTSDMITASSGGTTVNGTAGSGGTARSFQPRMLKLERSGGNLYVYWIENCATGSRRGGVVRAYVHTGSAALTYGAAPSISAGNVGTIIGDSGFATNSCSATAYGTAQRSMIIQSGVDLWPTTNGMYFTDNALDHIIYVNKNATDDTTTFGTWLNGATGAPSRASIKFAGVGNNQGSTIDGAIATSTNIREPYGITLNTDGTRLILADNDFGRLRHITLSSGIINTEVGSGNAPYGAIVNGGTVTTSTTAAPNVFLYHPTGLAIDNTNKKLYISEYTNNRVLELDLARGEADSSVGTTATGNYNDDIARGSTSMVGTTGLAHSDVYNSYTYPSPLTPPSLSGRHLIFANGSGSTGAGNPCMVRAVNFSSTSAGIFGTGNIAIDLVRTIVGKLSGVPTTDYGCTPTATSTNASWFSSSNANTVPLTQLVSSGGVYRSVALAVDQAGSPVMYVSLSEKNCILRVNSSGAITPVVGVCDGGTGDSGTSASNVNTSANHLTRPVGIAVDPDNPTNLFVLDQANQSIAKLKYINFGTSTISSGLFGGSITANTTAPTTGRIVTLLQFTGTPYVTDLAVNNSKVCVSSGRNDSTGQGENNVVCYNRTDGVTNLVCGGDTTQFPNRDGSPLSGAPGLLEADGITDSYGYQEKKACSTTAATNKGLVLLSGPSAIVFDSDGNLYIADRLNHLVRMVKGGW